MAWMTGWWQTGHSGSDLSHTLFAHSRQKRLWPHGTRAATTSLSKQITQSRLAFLSAEPSESVGLLEVLPAALDDPFMFPTPEKPLSIEVVVEGTVFETNVTPLIAVDEDGSTVIPVSGSLRIRRAGG